MTFWIIAAVVLVVGFALAWVSSGWSRPGTSMDRHSRRESDEQSYAQVRHGVDPNSFGGPFS